jgi:transcription elongation GreA/GreB family factor
MELQMTSFGIRTFQLTLGAVALTLAGWTTSAQAADEVTPPAHKHHVKKHGPARHHGARASDREAAAARRGHLGEDESDREYEHNALARCDVFKNEGDRHACVERVRHGSVSGSVEGGGTLTEYSQPAR